MIRKKDNSVFKNNQDRWGKCSSQHVTCQTEPTSCFSGKTDILWVLPFLQNMVDTIYTIRLQVREEILSILRRRSDSHSYDIYARRSIFFAEFMACMFLNRHASYTRDGNMTMSLAIYFIHLGNKDIYCTLKPCYEIAILFRTIHYLFQTYIYSIYILSK
jgi:hypothetical protein